MKKLFLASAIIACFAVSALGQSSPPLRVKEADGFPNVPGVTTIVVSNGSITSVEGKTIYLTTGGGGGGGSPGGSSTQVQYNAAGSFGGISGFTSDGTNVTAGSANLRATRPRFITSIDDTNGNEVFVITATASAVNEFTIANAATGGNPTISASGSDADINIRLTPKGAGGVVLSNGSASNAGLRFASDSTSVGWYRTAQSWTYTYTGTTQFALPSEGIRLSNGIRLAFSTGSAESSGSDTSLVRAATNTIRLANATTGAGNLIIGTSAGAIGTSGAGVLAFTLSTEPSTSPTDTAQLYYKDFAAADGRLYLRNEASSAGSPVANLGDAQSFTGKITFTPTASIAGVNVGSLAGDPSSPVNGDLWYDSTANELTARINGANVALGSGGGGGITVGTTTITSGTNTRVLYNNSGVVGEYSVSGTGNVLLSASPTTTGRLTGADANFTTAVTTGTGSTAGFQVTANSLTTGNGTEISSSSVSSGNVVSIAATGTAAASNSKHALIVATSGANATSTQTTFGAEITNTSTGTSSTNIGLRLTASGGTTNTALDVTAGQSLFTTGSVSAPGIAFQSNANWGFFLSSPGIAVTLAGTAYEYFRSDGMALASSGLFQWSSTTQATGTADTFMRRVGAASIALGNTDAASPVAQTLSVQNVVGGTSNTAGVNWTFAASRGTGTGAGGDIIFQTAPAGGSGTTQNTLATAFTIQDDGAVQLKSVTFANLPTVANGYLIYCSDCTIASPCASGGSGALAKGINGAWVCN